MAFLDDFAEWMQTVEVQRYSSSKNASGQIVGTWTTAGTFKAGIWTASGMVTNTSDKFVGKRRNNFVTYPTSFTASLDSTYRIMYKGNAYNITAVNAIGELSDVCLIETTADYKGQV